MLQHVITNAGTLSDRFPDEFNVATKEAQMKLQMLFAVVSLSLAGHATAQTAPNPGACKADAQKLCGSEVRTRDKAKIQACLVGNVAKVSAPCHDNLMAAKTAQAAK
jgi:hypothetical protein